ncbi:MAG: glycoside hydrolase family 15 protein [Ardenticatenaceae bacterium]|nr:glycoside hydrolase family 15 protein [Ardenticatenaceae bacterium]
MTTNLFDHSLRTIAQHQAATGAYVACPNFPTYRYSWFRDGALIAYAMDIAGQHQSARRFHDWAARAVHRHAAEAERAIEKAGQGELLGEDYLHARYTLDGEAAAEKWTNFQLDGLGTWLWALAEHQRRTTAALPSETEETIELTARYLSALWRRPCYDLWEEHPHLLHPYTLAAISAGLHAAAELLPTGGQPLTTVASGIKAFLLSHGLRNGHLIKSFAPPDDPSRSSVDPLPGAAPSVDASLLGVATPYRLLAPNDPIMQATVARIEADLRCPGSGAHRYRADTYYGGGEWLLLAAWLGWYYVEVRALERARELLRWVEAQANARGDLPEQVCDHLLAPAFYPQWKARWGPVATPLLWSHALYLILHTALRRGD